MNLRAEFETAWKAGNDHDFLLALVHRYGQIGLAPREAYWILHKLWLDCGFDNSDGTNPLQDNLEYILDKVWYE